MARRGRNSSGEQSDMVSDGGAAGSLTLGARLMTLSNLMRRITTLRFQRAYGLSLVEGWIVSHLGAGGAMSLDSLAFRCGLAKSQMSRSVTDMVSRKLVHRQRNLENKSEVILTLTAEGKGIFKAIKQHWPEYNKLLMTGMNDRQTADFAVVVGQMIENSRRNLLSEQENDAE